MISDRFVKILALLLPLMAFLGPLIYGLNEHNWSISSLITPCYTPPRIGVELKSEPPMFSDSVLVLRFQANNTGDVELKIISFDGVVYVSDGVELGRLNLVEQVMLPPGSSKDLMMSLKLKRHVLVGLASKLIESGRVNILVEGRVQVEIFGSVAEVPISESIEIKAEDLGVRSWASAEP